MIVTRAPLRIPLGGGGTDFPSYYQRYGGYILGFALNKAVHVVLHDTIDKKIRLKYRKNEEVDDVDQLENRIAAEALKWYGVTSGVEIATFSDVPNVSGLGGSSSFCVALVTALRYKLGMKLDKQEIFASAYDIERNKAGQPGGMQDQYFATFGGAWELFLKDVFERTRITVSQIVPRMKLVYTGTSRTDLGIADRQSKKSDSTDPSMIQNLTQVKILGLRIRDYIRRGDYENIGKLTHEHWERKKERDSSVTNTEVDKLYSQALEGGAIGGKLLGLGGGGYLLLFTNKNIPGLSCIPVGVDSEGCKVVYHNGR